MKPYNSRFQFTKGPDMLKIKSKPLVEDMNYYVVHVTSYIMLMKLSDMLNSRSKNIQIDTLTNKIKIQKNLGIQTRRNFISDLCPFSYV